MALKGNLQDFSTAQLLKLVSLAKRTGTLVMEGPDQTAQMAFRDGKLIYASIGGQDDDLAAILLKAGKLTESQAQVIEARAVAATDKELGLLAVNAGYVTHNDILASKRGHVVEIASQLFTWVEGTFHFEEARLPGNDKITVPIDAENVIAEGTRRMREAK